MTLTTEQLRARAKFWREKAVEAKWESVSIAQDMLQNADAFDELAANREAQPVLYASEETLAYAKEGEKSLVTWSEPMGDAVIPLFTAPPAPAKANQVAWEMRYWNSGHNMWGEWERITAEQHAEMSVQHAADNDYEFRVLYDVPQASQSTNVSDWGINMQTGTPILTYKNCCVIESEQAHYVLSLINSSAAPEGGN
ncbi:hypothetical protein I5U18_03230 [Serratia ureilytica]|uniref:hypothetical protein n=1 Tax=Serratia ureilytica TaxID=300181 RepID=UPI0018D3FF92|nr:hypothetical protein [Serratia ureilytica]MBH1909582.1 hypothetical protein [Serratia ureilytica]